MYTRPFGDTLTEIAGSLLSTTIKQQIVRATSVELSLPIEAKLRRSEQELLFCADVPSWRWRTEWDLPLGRLRLTLGEAGQEISE